MLHKYPNEGSHTYKHGCKYNEQIVICEDSKLSGMIDPKRIRFILKVFLTNILQVFLSIFITALAFTNFKPFVKLDKKFWFSCILSVISMGETIAIFFIQRFPHLKYLTDFLYLLFTFSFAGVIAFLSIYVEGMFIFISWILTIILSVLLFLVGINIERDLVSYFRWFMIYIASIILVILILLIPWSINVTAVTWAIGPLVLAIIIPASLIEAQILYGGREIYYRREDFIFASMIHLFLLTFSYSGFILMFLNINLT
uniref:N-methyl-D-aspartate receptor-associated protein, putative n=1 Tax=Schistosoma mansoni TaxID=6183 RepID=A0A3Q0KJT7_SCHMA